MAVDPTTGDVYVADSYNHRVQKFDSDGTYLDQGGENGTGNRTLTAISTSDTTLRDTVRFITSRS